MSLFEKKLRARAVRAGVDTVILDGLQDNKSILAAFVGVLVEYEAKLKMDQNRVTLASLVRAVGGDPSMIMKVDVLEVGPSVEEGFKTANLEGIRFTDRDDGGFWGWAVREQSVKLKANLGLAHGVRMLAESGDIPEEMRGKCIPLTATRVRAQNGNFFIAVLAEDKDRWCLYWRWLDGGDWSPVYVRLPRIKKPNQP